jgi:predicted ABC-type ATPase
VTNKKKKQVVIVAGANGSGKTTFARKFLDVTKYEFLNADEIAKEMNPQDPVKVRIAAGKQVINLLDQFIDEGKNFVIESTLSGSFLEKHIEELKQKGFEISLTFIFLGSKDLCIERIKSRVRQGGHNVPDEDVIRRFNRGLVKIWQDIECK